ncbi:MAG TPA: DEAD/DEAH box helicase, partial [Anaeromyxobacteraceae bacterium]|nr:DEAD/DEAH box helicase [Anaeromyxobacteraceae bacterium]
MRADDLLAAVFPAAVACQDNADLRAGPVELPDHPLVEEALRDCLTEAMDAEGLRALLERVERGEVRLVSRDLAEPSPMAHEILGARPWAFLDDAPLEERRARAVVLRRALPPAEAAGSGALDPAALAEVMAQVALSPRDAEEAHDLLLDLGLVPAAEAGPWRAPVEALRRDGRAASARSGEREWLVAAERVGLWRALAPASSPAAPATRLDPDLAPLSAERPPDGEEEAATRVLRGWVPHLGPTTAAAAAARLGLPESLVALALHALESEGLVLRGRFLPEAPWSAESPHWCERGLLARIHRLTLGRLRREIEPVPAADLVRFLTAWQHASPGRRLHGARGLLEVIGQLQGFHAPAGAWEREVLPARVAGYQPALLDQLCLSGEVAWGRLVVASGPEEAPRRRAAPTRNAPVTLLRRADLPWLLAATAGPPPPLGPSARALVEVLGRTGASFLPDLAAMTGRLPAEVEQALWELTSAGVVTCDGFAGLRALVDPASRQRGRRPAFAGGRWSLLRPASPAPAEGAESPLERLAGQYLQRYGVVLRDLAAREAGAPAWRDLLPVYRRLEAQGRIRGGRFVAGSSGEQFALPEAVEALRAARRAEKSGERVELSAADPLNLVGVLLPGDRVAATLGNRVAFVDGVPADPAERRAL